jgi:hypothetical protein
LGGSKLQAGPRSEGAPRGGRFGKRVVVVSCGRGFVLGVRIAVESARAEAGGEEEEEEEEEDKEDDAVATTRWPGMAGRAREALAGLESVAPLRAWIWA